MAGAPPEAPESDALTSVRVSHGGQAQAAAPGRDEKLSVPRRFLYAAPSLSTTSLTMLIAVYANDFYVSLGASLGFLSFFTALARSFDVITDPLMGWISDSTSVQRPLWGQTWLPVGRRRPYMFMGPIFFCIFFTLLFYPPPFYPNIPGDQKSYDINDPTSDFYYGLNVEGQKAGDAYNNVAAGYWFGVFYVLFYLSDTFTNVPYEALGPELSSVPSERSKLFFSQKLINFLGMLVAAASPSGLAYIIRVAAYKNIEFPCDYVYHPNSTDAATEMLHGTLPNQLLYIDAHPEIPGVIINKTADFCVAGTGDFCFERLYENGTHYWYEQSVQNIQAACEGQPASAPLVFERYTMSSISADQLAYFVVALCFGVYHIGAMWTLVKFTTERDQVDTGVSLPLVSSIMRSLNNAAFTPLLLAWLLDGLALAALVTMFPFYIRYVIQPDGVEAQARNQALDAQICMAAFVFVLLLMAMFSSAGWLWASQRFGKFAAWQAFNFFNAMTNLGFFFVGPGDSMLVIGLGALNGIPVGGQFLVNSIMSDVIDYDEFLNATRSEGAFSVFATLIPKFVAIPASAIPLAIINLLGFKQPIDGIVQPQPSQVLFFIKMCFVLLPFTCAVLSFIVKFRYPIKRDDLAFEVSKGIAAFKEGQSKVLDPILNIMISQRNFTIEEEKQATVMEMYTERQLLAYKQAVEAAHGLGDALTDTMRTAASGATQANQPAPAAASMTRIVFPITVTYGVLMCASLVLTICTFPLLQQQRTSIVPVMCCIAFGLLVCMFGINYLRWRAAPALESFQGEGGAPSASAGDIVPGQGGSGGVSEATLTHVRLLSMLLEMKHRGAAGGKSLALATGRVARALSAATKLGGKGKVTPETERVGVQLEQRNRSIVAQGADDSGAR